MMSRRRSSSLLGALLLPLCTASALACSSSSTPATKVVAKDAGRDVATNEDDGGADAGADAAPTEGGGGGSDARPDVSIITDNQDCVAPGTASSEEGLGGYCSPMGGQCVATGLGGVATLCSGDLGAPAHEWFCTVSCMQTSDCGAGGGACLMAPFGQICVPTACADHLGDAGSGAFDGGDVSDASSATDAAHDSATPHDSAPDSVSSKDAAGE